MVEMMAGRGRGFFPVGDFSLALPARPFLPPPAARPTVDSTKTHHIKENCYDQR